MLTLQSFILWSMWIALSKHTQWVCTKHDAIAFSSCQEYSPVPAYYLHNLVSQWGTLCLGLNHWDYIWKHLSTHPGLNFWYFCFHNEKNIIFKIFIFWIISLFLTLTSLAGCPSNLSIVHTRRNTRRVNFTVNSNCFVPTFQLLYISVHWSSSVFNGKKDHS